MASMKDYIRMCNYHEECDNCPIDKVMHEELGEGFHVCVNVVYNNFDKYEAIVEEWCKTHKVKTYADDLREKFPNIQTLGGRPVSVCRKVLYRGEYESADCSGDCEACWKEEMPYEKV